MKLKHAAVSVLLTLACPSLSFADKKNVEVNEINDLEARLWAATDHRDGQNPVFDEALAAEKYQALVMLGQIGGDACEKIIPYLVSNDGARPHARKGAMLCHNDGLSEPLMTYTAPLRDKGEIDYLLPALGFSGGEAARPLLIDRVNAVLPGKPFNVGYPDNARTLPLFGLLQSVVYDRLAPDAVPELDFGNLLSLSQEMGTAEMAAYLLTRFTKLDSVLNRLDVEDAIDFADNDPVRMSLTRVLRQFGDEAGPKLVELANGSSKAVAIEALRAMGQLSDEVTLKYLVKATGKGDVHRRQVAIAALGGRDKGEAVVVKKLKELVGEHNSWLAATALESLVFHANAEAVRYAEGWLSADEYYRAFKALGVLGRSDEGKAVLRGFVEENAGTARGRDAAITLDPSIEAKTTPRATPRFDEVQTSLGRELVLQTTKGTICILPSDDAPFAAHSFMELADAGKMDGMIWLRVIPNFVAQGGLVADTSTDDWGSIREEWFDSDHRIGTVGLATAGKDTGSTQFFINTAHNIHLNNRYTVFGHVAEGLDVAFALEEGDIIEKAWTAAAPTAACK
ncbi:peptidylprolyl isomerase [Kordiimonas aestuarii]|uniref:peptidylprolyl isomerase n=1 Tax=Kordiimonas aestuarii TaxID=1005925 RepID=UPI0021D2F4F4|nr:peptidylprolyl isomerase [Kordiimonas aestuarii]